MSPEPSNGNTDTFEDDLKSLAPATAKDLRGRLLFEAGAQAAKLQIERQSRKWWLLQTAALAMTTAGIGFYTGRSSEHTQSTVASVTIDSLDTPDITTRRVAAEDRQMKPKKTSDRNQKTGSNSNEIRPSVGSVLAFWISASAGLESNQPPSIGGIFDLQGNLLSQSLPVGKPYASGSLNNQEFLRELFDEGPSSDNRTRGFGQLN